MTTTQSTETATIAGQIWTITRYQHFVTLINARGTARMARNGVGPMFSLSGANHTHRGNVVRVRVTETTVEEVA